MSNPFLAPSSDFVSEVYRQELRNIVDKVQRELANRFDFKNTDSSIDKGFAKRKTWKRNVSLKGIEWGKIKPSSGESVRRIVTVTVGISSDKARETNR